MPAKTKETNEKKVTKKTAKKTTVQSSLNKSKVSAKKAVKTSKKTTTKKNATPKAKNNLIKKTAKTKNKVKTSAKKVANKKQPINIVESYDLPYRYNETIVKILYQRCIHHHLLLDFGLLLLYRYQAYKQTGLFLLKDYRHRYSPCLNKKAFRFY